MITHCSLAFTPEQFYRYIIYTILNLNKGSGSEEIHINGMWKLRFRWSLCQNM